MRILLAIALICEASLAIAAPVPKELRKSDNRLERIGRIRIEGNAITEGEVVLKVLNFAVGDTLDFAKFTKAETQLMRLGIFDVEVPPKVSVENTESAIGFVTIVVRVKETRLGVIHLHTGPNSNAGLYYYPRR